MREGLNMYTVSKVKHFLEKNTMMIYVCIYHMEGKHHGCRCHDQYETAHQAVPHSIVQNLITKAKEG